MAPRRLLLAALLALPAACGSQDEPSPHDIEMVDSLGQLGPFGPPDRRPHYATGTEVEFWVFGEEALEPGWVIASDRDDVLRLGETEESAGIASVGGSALAPGTAVLSVFDEEGRLALEREVVVEDVKRILLSTSHGGAAHVLGDRARVIAGERGHFTVGYEGERRLLGAIGILRAADDEDLASVALVSWIDRLYEELVVRALPSGAYPVDLIVADEILGTIEVLAVQVAEAELHVRRDGGEAAGETGCLVAWLEDELERPVSAGIPHWDLGGGAERHGSHLCFTHDPAVEPIEVMVTVGPFEESVSIQGAVLP